MVTLIPPNGRPLDMNLILSDVVRVVGPVQHTHVCAVIMVCIIFRDCMYAVYCVSIGHMYRDCWNEQNTFLMSEHESHMRVTHMKNAALRYFNSA